VRSFAGLSPQRPLFDLRSVHVRFVVDKVALRQVCLPVLVFSPVSIITPVLLCTGGQVGKTWEPSNKPMFFRISAELCAPCSVHVQLLTYLTVSSPHDSSNLPIQNFKSRLIKFNALYFRLRLSELNVLPSSGRRFSSEKLVPIYDNKWVHNTDHQNSNYCPPRFYTPSKNCKNNY
jgi:hypothetical protein